MIEKTNKVQQALREFTEVSQLEENRICDRKKLLQKVILQFDLNPLEENFLWRHYQECRRKNLE